MIYKYRKTTDQYTTYTLIAENAVELATIDGWTYVSVPGDNPLPEQPTAIAETVAAVEMTPELNLEIKMASSMIQYQLSRLNVDVNLYLYAHYDPGTQSSFNGIYAKRSTPDAIKDKLDTVWDWIATVMEYYYSVKTELMTEEILETVSWDFSAFDTTKPDVTLAGVIAELAA